MACLLLTCKIRMCASDVKGSSSDKDIVEQVYVYKTKNQYPDGARESKKRVIRKKAKRFVVKDGELYYIQRKTKHKVSIRLNDFIIYLNLKQFNVMDIGMV